MGPSPPPETSRRRSEVLVVARQTLLDQGADGFVMRRIADRAGMKLGNLQYYFATRDDLLEAILRAEHVADFGLISAETEVDTVIEALVGRFAGPTPSVYSLVGALAAHNRQLMTAWAEVHEQIYGLVSGLIQRFDSSVTPSQARIRSILVMALIEGSPTQVYRSTGATSAEAMMTQVAAAARAVAKSA
ncbi:MAG: TetR/AcrR family transcriptional regulator [Actinobacteria bacterium]|nr:TetR/AcrR family transcriptional regulator [Actinomycetota bacterium]